jgi:phosphatidylserine/phosphatidylglycerophosphate/cardiolipin synthase-like enzyme
MVDEKPYGMNSSKVSSEANSIKSTGAQFKWAPSRFTSQGHNYAFYHAKYMCNTHECEVGTPNFDWSAFHKNREYFDITSNQKVVKTINTIFNSDWNRLNAPAWVHQSVVLSPGTSAGNLLAVIKQPGRIFIESEELGSYKNILYSIASKGSNAYLILPSSLSRADMKNVNFLKTHGVHIRFMNARKRYMHAKLIVGDKIAYIGSENFTYTSLYYNREIGVILDGQQDIATLDNQFRKDWAASTTSGSSGIVGKLSGFLARFR